MTTHSRNRVAPLARATARCLIVLAGLAVAANARAECSRDGLRQLAETYVKAILALPEMAEWEQGAREQVETARLAGKKEARATRRLSSAHRRRRPT